MFTRSLFRTLIFTFAAILVAIQPISAQTNPTRGAGNKSKAAASQASAAEPAKPKKKIIVVLEFDDASLGNESQKRPMGRQIAILLSNEFARRSNFTVIERLSIDKVLDDQNRSFGGRYDSTQASKIGKVFSASTVVLGTITEYSTRKKNVGVGGVFGKSTYLAKVGLAIRLVDVNTGEVQDSVTVEGNADSKSMATVGYGSSTEISEELKTSLYTEATNQAISKGVDQLERLIDKSLVPPAGQASPTANTTAQPAPEEKKKGGGIFGSMFGKKDKESKPAANNSAGAQPAPGAVAAAPAASPAAAPKVVNVSEGKVYLRNTFPSAKVGGQLIIYRVKKTITDEETGEIIGTETEEVARIEILEIQEKMIIAKVLSGGTVQKNDLVKALGK